MTVIVGQTLDENLTSEEIFSKILESRGLDTLKKVEAFLHPENPVLDSLLKEIPVNKNSLSHAKKILSEKIKEGKDILVFGDYDADGLTSTAIMWIALMGLSRGSKSRVLPFVPDRHRHGYGLSEKALADLFDGTAFKHTSYPDFNPALIITVDNGIVAVKEIGELKARGVQVIVTDHHQEGDSLPPADAIIHASVTSGAGIAYLTALFFTHSHPAVRQMLGIATVGIVADQMPLVGINRDLVVHGLKSLESSSFPGISALKKSAGVDGRPLTTYDINFAIAPRLNAVGRLDNPLDGLRLLCTRDHTQAAQLAGIIESHNINRQDLTDKAIKSALKRPVEHNLIIVSSKEYHEGIIGLVAGKLVENYHRPALAISLGEQVSKGSARSLPGINITEILRKFSQLFLGLGGHEQAAGFSLENNNLPKLEKVLYEYADTHIDPSLLIHSVRADFSISLKQCSLTLARDIRRLEPFGIGNWKPRFYVENLHVLEHRTLGVGGKHLKLVVEQNGVSRDALIFNYQKNCPKFIKSMIFTLDINHWRDRDYLQLIVDYVA